MESVANQVLWRLRRAASRRWTKSKVRWIAARMAGSMMAVSLEIAARDAGARSIVISGSVYLVGEARSLLLGQGEPGEGGARL